MLKFYLFLAVCPFFLTDYLSAVHDLSPGVNSAVPLSPSPAFCRLISITEGKHIIRLAYDARGQLATLDDVDGATVYLTRYFYDGNLMKIIHFGMGELKTDSLVLSADGLVRDGWLYTGSGNRQVSFTYSSDGEIKTRISKDEGRAADTTRFLYRDGDPFASIFKGDTTTFTYDTTKPALTGNVIELMELMEYRFHFMKTKHLVTGMREKGKTTSFSYTFAPSGMIRTVTRAVEDGPPQTIQYEFDCK